MIETVSTSSVQNAALRAAPQASGSSRSVEPVSKANEFFVSSRIRMDNLLDLAILEYRNTNSGDVIRQYPSESQIRAFQRAAELEAEFEPAETSPVPVEVISDNSVSQNSFQPVAAAPSPSAPASSSPSVPEGGSTTQSIVV